MMNKINAIALAAILLMPGIGQAERLTIGQCNVDGQTVLSESDVRDLAVSLSSGSPNPIECYELASLLEAQLRRSGAFAAKVYVDHAASGASVDLKVIEGRLAENGILLGRQPSHIDGEIIVAQLEGVLQPGSLLLADKYERAILLTNDLPGVGGSSSKLFPADAVGEATFEIFPTDGKRVEGEVFTDNFGSGYTGRSRIGATLSINSPFKQGERFSLGANATSKETGYGYADASLPVLHHGMRAGVTVDALEYRTGQDDHLRGSYRHASAYLLYPFVRSRVANLTGEVRVSHDSMQDRDDLSVIADRVVDALALTIHGSRFDEWSGGGESALRIHMVTGRLDLGGYVPYQTLDAQTARTAGHFSRMVWSLSRMQRISGPWQTLVEVAGQLASRHLDSSQAIAFGGPNFFPGYAAGEVIGDSGYRAHGDLRYNMNLPWLGGKQQLSAYYDYGRISTHARQIVGGFVIPGVEERTYGVHSLGIGFSHSLQAVDLQGALGWRVNNEIPTELLADKRNHKMYGWLHLVYKF